MYNCGCVDCKNNASQLNLSIGDSFKQLLNVGKNAFKRLHEIGTYKPEDLKNEKVYQDLINQTFDVFNFAISDNDMPNEMRTALQEDAFLFGGLKTHAQLFEASKLLLDDNGNLKPFRQLSNEFDKLNSSYNKNYLEAEYEFAVSSSQMAAKWSEFSNNDRYYLQYRTAGDNRVREEHAALSGITLPKDDPFWSSYTPPNGWNCRCTVVEVLKDKYPLSDSVKSITAGEKATTQIGKEGKNRLEIFRFNPGADKKLFPPLHPNNKIAGAKAATPIILTMFSEKPDFKNTKKELITRLVKGKVQVKRKELNKPITFTSKGIGDAVNKPHEFIADKNKMLLNIDKVLKKATYLGSEPDYKKNPMVKQIHVFEIDIKGVRTFLINRELTTGEIHFYSVSDGEMVIKDIKK
ncbi:MAG: minor capsid protein [Flavobacteriaceae bacterium]|nr:minor capsid protein [Flavobacteriaceae bacterium]